jgi:nitrite reductase (NO-forming)
VLDLAPASGGFVETVFAQPGSYPFLTHALADAEQGAHGAVQVTP